MLHLLPKKNPKQTKTPKQNQTNDIQTTKMPLVYENGLGSKVVNKFCPAVL